MRIALASDHAGFDLKERLRPLAEGNGHDVVDCGCWSRDRVDYLEYTLSAVVRLTRGECDRAILACGNGFAMAMVANRFPGIRAAVCHDSYSARTSREMGDSNILVFGARVVAAEYAAELAAIWLATGFRGEEDERYAQRLEAVRLLDTLIVAPDWLSRLELLLPPAGRGPAEEARE